MAALLTQIRDEIAARLGPALDELAIERAVLGLFFVGVKLDNGAGGLCATPLKSMPQAVCCPSSAQAMPAPGKLRGRRASQALLDLERGGPLRRALAIATLNALVESVLREAGLPEGTQPGKGDALAHWESSRITMWPWWVALRPTCANSWAADSRSACLNGIPRC